MPDLSRITLVPNRPGWHAAKLVEECGIVRPPVDQGRIMERLKLKLREFLYREYPGMTDWDDDNPEEVAFLKPSEQRIYVHKNTFHTRKRMSIFHECGHYYLPWHRGVDYLCDERRLSPLVKEQLERQAFEFATSVIMPRRMFVDDMLSLPLGLDAVNQLRRRYEASYLAAAIWYAKVHPGRCLFFCMGPAHERTMDASGKPRTSEHLKKTRLDGPDIQNSRPTQLGLPLRAVPGLVIIRKKDRPKTGRHLVVHYSFPSPRFGTFIRKGVEVWEGTRLYGLWLKAQSERGVVTSTIPMTDFGPSFWDHRYFVKVDCRSYADHEDNRTILGLLSLPDRQRTWKI